MSRVAIPLDSVAIVPASGGDAASRTWSEEFAKEIAQSLVADGDLRVVPPERTRAFAATGDDSPEEIGRRVDARCAVHCAVTVDGDALDVRVAIIDVLAESAVCETSYLSSVDEAVRVQEQIARWLGECCFAGVSPRRRESVDSRSYARGIAAKALRREGRFAEAIALIRDDRAALATFAEIVVDAPSRVLDAGTIALARIAATEADDLVAARILCRFERDWDAAAAAFARAVSRRGDPAVHAHYGLFLAAMRRFDEAEIELRIAAELSDPMMPERLLVERGLTFCGRVEDRRSRLSNLDHDRYAEAVAHALAGESDAALEALRDAAASYSPHVMFAGVDPAFIALRGEPRFAEVLHNLRIP
jgi:hypothetical protein